MPITSYSTYLDKGAEGLLLPYPDHDIIGSLYGYFNADSGRLPYGRLVADKGSTAGGVGLPTKTSATLRGFTYYQALDQADYNTLENGIVALEPVALVREGLLLVLPETNITKGSEIYLRCILNATLGTYEALGRIRGDADNITISNVALTSNVATITAVAHGLTVGQVVTIAGLTTTALNGTYTVVSTPTVDTFTFAKTNANISSSADSGTIARAMALSDKFLRIALVESAVAGVPCYLDFELK